MGIFLIFIALITAVGAGINLAAIWPSGDIQ
jgi:hypothetical protein